MFPKLPCVYGTHSTHWMSFQHICQLNLATHHKMIQGWCAQLLLGKADRQFRMLHHFNCLYLANSISNNGLEDRGHVF